MVDFVDELWLISWSIFRDNDAVYGRMVDLWSFPYIFTRIIHQDKQKPAETAS
jgi:hypothetical protein